MNRDSFHDSSRSVDKQYLFCRPKCRVLCSIAACLPDSLLQRPSFVAEHGLQVFFESKAEHASKMGCLMLSHTCSGSSA